MSSGSSHFVFPYSYKGEIMRQGEVLIHHSTLFYENHYQVSHKNPYVFSPTGFYCFLTALTCTAEEEAGD